MGRAFDPPKPGDIVYCYFPQVGIPKPGPKPRPAVVLQVGTVDETPYVRVAYGTSRKTTELNSGEFLISPDDATAFTLSGLAYATKFDLGKTYELPFNDVWFRVPPMPTYGQSPKLGVLHPSLMKRAEAAFRSAKPQGSKPKGST